jgi:flavodoxin
VEHDILKDKGNREKKGSDPDYSTRVKSLVIVFSSHHGNTAKIADACAKVLGATVKTPKIVRPEELEEYDLVGFGSGIYSATFHKSLLDLADRLPPMNDRRAFLFSTFGAPSIVANREFVEKNHRRMREKLQEKGYTIIGEFGCAGWNTNSFLKYFGGLNKGRPDAGDLRNAEDFTKKVMGIVRGEDNPLPGEISWFPRK